MSGWSLGLVSALALASGLACAMGGTSEPNTNRDACVRYAEHLNTLTPCVGLTYDPDNWCEGSERLVVDMTGYYDCLRSNASCEGEMAKLDVAHCTPPLVTLQSDPAPRQ